MGQVMTWSISSFTHEEHLYWSRVGGECTDVATQSKAGIVSNHERWHVKRGKVSPFCELCNPDKRVHRPLDNAAACKKRRARHQAESFLADVLAAEAAANYYAGVEIDDFAEQFDSLIRHKGIDVAGCKCDGCIKVRLNARKKAE